MWFILDRHTIRTPFDVFVIPFYVHYVRAGCLRRISHVIGTVFVVTDAGYYVISNAVYSRAEVAWARVTCVHIDARNLIDCSCIDRKRVKMISQPAKMLKSNYGGVNLCRIGIQYVMLNSQKDTPPHCFFLQFYWLGIVCILVIITTCHLY